MPHLQALHKTMVHLKDCIPVTAGRCSVSDSMQQLPKRVPWANRKDSGPSFKGGALVSGNVTQSAVAEHVASEMRDIE